MSKLREFLKTIGDYDDEGFIELIVDCNDGVVWEDSALDEHRWYARREVVVKVEGKFVWFNKYLFTGDFGMSDMDLEYDLDKDFALVEPMTRVVEETYYVNVEE